MVVWQALVNVRWVTVSPSRAFSRKKKKRKLLDTDAVEAEWKTVNKQTSEGQQVAKKTKPDDHKTKAEKKYDKVQKERVSAVQKHSLSFLQIKAEMT